MSFSFKALGARRRTPAADAEKSPAPDPSSAIPSADDLRLVMERIVRLERVLKDAALLSAGNGSSSPGHAIDDEKIRRIIRARRIREQQLGGELFSDPAWDMLLEAFAADLRQEWLTVSHLLQASRVPDTTALRWMKLLEQDGWLEEAESPDGRKWMALTAQGSGKLRRYFDAIGPASFLV